MTAKKDSEESGEVHSSDIFVLLVKGVADGNTKPTVAYLDKVKAAMAVVDMEPAEQLLTSVWPIKLIQ